MFSSINSQGEEIRAQRILSSLTEYEKAVEVFAPMHPQGEEIRAQAETNEPTANANRNNGQFIMQIFKAIKLNRHPVVDEPVQHPIRSPQQRYSRR